MIPTIRQYLAVIDGRSGEWRQEARQQNESGNNYLIILPDHEFAVSEFGKVLEASPESVPKVLNRHRLFLLSPYIGPRDFDVLMLAEDDGYAVRFIEQLDLPATQPPRVKPYLVYCSIRGIIAQSDDLFKAREVCADYFNALSLLRNQHEAGIYRWESKDWYSLDIS